jgi:hypothetical protein
MYDRDFQAGFLRGIIPFASAFNLPRAPSDFFYPGRARSFHLGETVGASLGLTVDVLGIVTGMGMFVGGGGLGILALPESFGLSLAPASGIAVAGLEIAGLSAVSGIGHGSNLVDALARGVQLNHNRDGTPAPAQHRKPRNRDKRPFSRSPRRAKGTGNHRGECTRCIPEWPPLL